MINREVVKTDAGRVTAGIPSLDSSKRFQIDSDFVSKDYARKIDAEQDRNLSLSVEDDGERPTSIADCESGSGSVAGTWYSPDQVIQKLLKLNCNLWFERSATVPSQMMCCLRVPVSEDYPKGLRYIGGFPADVRISENTRYCKRTRMTHSRDGIMRKVIEPCSDPQCKSCGGLKQIRGWYSVCARLISERLASPTRVEVLFHPTMSRNKKRFLNGA